jgi:hypothetical protein
MAETGIEMETNSKNMENMGEGAEKAEQKNAKTKAEAKEMKEQGTITEEEKQKLEEKQSETFEQFMENSVQSTGKISKDSQIKLKKIYSQTYEDLVNQDGDTQKVKDLKNKLQRKMQDYLGSRKNITENIKKTPLSQFSSIFADGASVLDPNTSTLKKWSDYVKEKVGIETVKTTSPFGELVEEQIRQANTPEMENAHKKMKQQYAEIGKEIQRNIEGASGKTVTELAEEEKNMTQEEIEKRNNDIKDKVAEKKGSKVAETIFQFLKIIGILAVIGTGYFVGAAMCHRAQQNSGCVARDPTDPSKKVGIESPDNCDYSCPTPKGSCISCCGNCEFFFNINQDEQTVVEENCCNHSIDKQKGFQEREGWKYDYNCVTGFDQLLNDISTLAQEAAKFMKNFFNTIWKYVVIIGVAIAAIVIIMMISKFSGGKKGKGKISPVAIGLSAAIVIAIVIWGLVTKWKFISTW